MSSATPKATIRSGKKSAGPAKNPEDEAWACSTLAPDPPGHARIWQALSIGRVEECVLRPIPAPPNQTISVF